MYIYEGEKGREGELVSKQTSEREREREKERERQRERERKK